MLLECLIIGDSIAHGLASVRPECISMSSIGINSREWHRQFHARPAFDMAEYNTVIISLGTNDLTGSDYERWMRSIRKTANGKRVIWLLPSASKRAGQRDSVWRIAGEFGDGVLDISPLTGADQIHPPTVKAYEKLAEFTR